MPNELRLILLRNTSQRPFTEFAVSHALTKCNLFSVINVSRRIFPGLQIPLKDEFVVDIQAKDAATSKEDMLKEIEDNVRSYDVESYLHLNTREAQLIQAKQPSQSIDHFKLEDDNSSIDTLLAAFKDQSSAAQLFFEIAKNHFDKKEYLDAISLFKKAYNLFKKNNGDSIHHVDVAKALYCISSCAYQMKNLHSAINFLNMACMIIRHMDNVTPEKKVAYYTKLGRLYSEKGMYKEALDWYTTAKMLSSNKSEVHSLEEKITETKVLNVDWNSNLRSNPFGIFNQMSQPNGDAVIIQKTSSKSAPNGLVVSVETVDVIIQPLKPYDPSKWNLILDAAAEATRSENDLKFERILTSVPAEKRKEIFEHLIQLGINNAAIPASLGHCPRPYNEEEARLSDPCKLSESVPRLRN